jgi:hypothetical protein
MKKFLMISVLLLVIVMVAGSASAWMKVHPGHGWGKIYHPHPRFGAAVAPRAVWAPPVYWAPPIYYGPYYPPYVYYGPNAPGRMGSGPDQRDDREIPKEPKY